MDFASSTFIINTTVQIAFISNWFLKSNQLVFKKDCFFQKKHHINELDFLNAQILKNLK